MHLPRPRTAPEACEARGLLAQEVAALTRRTLARPAARSTAGGLPAPGSGRGRWSRAAPPFRPGRSAPVCRRLRREAGPAGAGHPPRGAGPAGRTPGPRRPAHRLGRLPPRVIGRSQRQPATLPRPGRACWRCRSSKAAMSGSAWSVMFGVAPVPRNTGVAPVFRRVGYLAPSGSDWMVDDAGWAASVAQ
jgi:hypothetical protein